MKVKSVEKQEKSTVELVIEVNQEEFEVAIEKTYKKKRAGINVPGFRKGHAPRKVIEGMYGSGVFYEDAINEVYPVAYAQAIEQENLDAVAWPDVEIQDANKDGFSFKAIVTVRPEVKLGAYKGLTAPKEEVLITEEDLDGEIKPFIERATRLVAVERAAELGDTVVLDFDGYKDGVPFDGGMATGHSLELGSHSFIPGFEEQVVGMMVDDEKDLEVTFPTDYQAEELAGAPVVFKVKLHEIKAKEIPAVDDEFAKDVSEFETLADFRKDLGDKLKVTRESQTRRAFEEALMEQAADNMEVEIPDAMVEYQAEKLLNSYAQRVTSQGIPFERYLSMMGMTIDEMKVQAHESALVQVRKELVLSAIVAAEDIQATEAELEAELAKLAAQYKMNLEQIKEAISAEDLKSDIALRKATDVIYDSAKIGPAPEKKEETPEAVEAIAEVPVKKAPRKSTAKKVKEDAEKE